MQIGPAMSTFEVDRKAGAALIGGSPASQRKMWPFKAVFFAGLDAFPAILCALTAQAWGLDTDVE